MVLKWLGKKHICTESCTPCTTKPLCCDCNKCPDCSLICLQSVEAAEMTQLSVEDLLFVPLEMNQLLHLASISSKFLYANTLFWAIFRIEENNCWSTGTEKTQFLKNYLVPWAYVLWCLIKFEVGLKFFPKSGNPECHFSVWDSLMSPPGIGQHVLRNDVNEQWGHG